MGTGAWGLLDLRSKRGVGGGRMAPGHLVWDLGDSGVVPRDGESRRTSGSGECCQAQPRPSSVRGLGGN